MIIGITGVFGSGKSTVLRLAGRRGWATISADEVVRALLKEPRVKTAVRQNFGNGVFAADGEVDRQALAGKVFSDPERLRRLEGILHPLVKQKIADKIQACRQAGRPLAVEVPLLLESGWEPLFDQVVCVSAEPATIRKRLCRQGFSREAILRRTARQWSLRRKEAASDFVIDNNGPLADTEQEAMVIFQQDYSPEEKE